MCPKGQSVYSEHIGKVVSRDRRNTFDMAAFVKRRHGLFSRAHEHCMRTQMSVTPNGERDAWGMAATMDHSDIRGLGTAFHLFLAGLPRSRVWDHHMDARIKPSRIPLIVPAHRVAVSVLSWRGVWLGE
jgi:hypothetical protein